VPVEKYPYALHPLDSNIEICRYLEWWKFADLIETGELYFNRADRFPKDDQECLPPMEYVAANHGWHPLDVGHRQDLDNHLGFLSQLRESYYGCCWQALDTESVQMWREYAQDGVILYSRYELLRHTPDQLSDQGFISLVRYGSAHLHGGNVLQYMLTKREQFAHEKEVRAMLWVRDEFAGMNRHFDEENRPHPRPLTCPPDRVPICQRRGINLQSLVTRIVVNPWAEAAVLETTNRLLNGKGLTKPVEESQLARYRALLPLIVPIP
jgi:hypothetical protein